MPLFGKELTPQEQVRAWKHALKAEDRKMDRQIQSIQREELKVKKTIKDCANRGDRESCKNLAKELIGSHKAVNRLYRSKAQINSVVMQMQQNLATAKMAGHLQKSAEIMRMMNTLVKVPEVGAVMQAMSKEMMKAGIIEEMIDDTMNADEDEELEGEAEAEVDKVMFEITHGLIGKAPTTTGTEKLGKGKEPAEEEPAEEEPAEEEQNMEEVRARLDALKG